LNNTLEFKLNLPSIQISDARIARKRVMHNKHGSRCPKLNLSDTQLSLNDRSISVGQLDSKDADLQAWLTHNAV